MVSLLTLGKRVSYLRWITCLADLFTGGCGVLGAHNTGFLPFCLKTVYFDTKTWLSFQSIHRKLFVGFLFVEKTPSFALSIEILSFWTLRTLSRLLWPLHCHSYASRSTFTPFWAHILRKVFWLQLFHQIIRFLR